MENHKPQENNEGRAPALAATAGSAPLAGQKYMLNHCRFGRATVKVVQVGDTWADCEILSGKLVGITEEWRPGDVKTVRIEHGSWTLVPNVRMSEPGAKTLKL